MSECLPALTTALLGFAEAAPRRRAFAAGVFQGELMGGRFGPLQVNGHEVWHGLAYLLRDIGWGTPEPVFDKIFEQTHADGLLMELKGQIPCAPENISGSPGKEARLDLKIQLSVHAGRELRLRAEVEPNTDLNVNRCGWVLMHPLSCSGLALEVDHVDGRTCRSSWPYLVPPWPLFTGVREIRHEYAPGYWASAQFCEEDYEVEDQRNNADASFKTYSRSNMMPRPYVLRRGQSIVREIRLRLLGETAPPKSKRQASPLPGWSSATEKTAQLGLAVTAEMTLQPVPGLIKLLQVWRPAYLHLTLWPEEAAPNWSGLLALMQAARCGLRIDFVGHDELGLGGTDDQECLALSQAMAEAGIVPELVAALPCGPMAARWLRQRFPGTTIGGGTPHYFAQLNRLELSGGEDFMSFTVCPTVHGADDVGVMHSLRSLPSMLQTARVLHPGRSWHLGPSALSARASPLGPQPPSNPYERKALAKVDPRTRSLFGAAWLLGHVAAALQAKVDAISLPALIGDDGLCEVTSMGWQESPAMAWLAVCFSWSSLQCLDWDDTSKRPFGEEVFLGWPLASIAGKLDRGWQVLIANLSDEPSPLLWPLDGTYAMIDAEAWANHRGTRSPDPWPTAQKMPGMLIVQPYALVRIDIFSKPVNSEHAS